MSLHQEERKLKVDAKILELELRQLKTSLNRLKSIEDGDDEEDSKFINKYCPLNSDLVDKKVLI